MNNAPDLSSHQPKADQPVLPPHTRPTRSVSRGFLAVLAIMGAVFLIVASGFVLDASGSHVTIKGSQTKAVAQARQIGLALRLYADDNNGVYPTGVNTSGETIRTSNDAFRNLFPLYLQSENIFGNKLSAYQTLTPDNVIEPPREILKPGENVYGYVMGVTGEMPPETPLIADGGDGAGVGHYVTTQSARGGVWSGTKAIVVRLDNSAACETLVGLDNARYVPFLAPDGTKKNLLSPGTLGPKLHLLEPAVDHR